MDKNFVAVAKILGAHGIKGALKLRCDLMNIEDILNYNLYDEAENPIEIEVVGEGKKGSLLIKFPTIDDRNKAEKLVGKDLFIKRSELPDLEDEDEYYYHDIIGLKVMHKGKIFGHVKDMYNYGAGEILEIVKEDNKVELFSFNNSTFPTVDLENNYIEINIE
jgi:16S rRNA processing protein RimM